MLVMLLVERELDLAVVLEVDQPLPGVGIGRREGAEERSAAHYEEGAKNASGHFRFSFRFG
jgi:hypothetical protein